MNYPKDVTVIEVGPRDGFQMEKEFIPTEKKIQIINSLAGTGIRKIEVTSFVRIPQMRDSKEVIERIDRLPGVKYAVLVPNLVGAKKAVESNVDEIVIVVAATDSVNKNNVNMSIQDSLKDFEEIMLLANGSKIPVRGGIAVAFGCRFEGNVPPENVLYIVDCLLSIGIKEITLGDSTGMATPPIVRQLCGLIIERHPTLDLSLHFHNTRGIGLVNVLVALEMGITKYDSSVGGLGGCPFVPGATGNIPTEDLVYLLEELDIQTGIDLDRLIVCAKQVEQILGRQLPSHLMKAGGRLSGRSVCNG